MLDDFLGRLEVSLSRDNENMSGLVIKIVNVNAVYLSLSVIPCAIAHCVCIPMLKCSFQTGCPRLWDCVYWQFLWCESKVLDNWQLTMLPLSELCEFNSLWTRENFSSSLWVIGCFPQPEKKPRIFMYVCVRACMCTCIYACLHVCLHARVSVRMHSSTVVFVRRVGLMRSQQDSELWWSVPFTCAWLY